MQENVKQIIVKMTARRAFRTEPIYQYDVGHELVFEGFDLPGAFEVHFSLSPMGKSITQVGQDGVCVLPDMYAQTAAPIYAWLYIADTETGLTKYSIEIPVQRRAKPTDQQPTPVQQSAIDQAIAALNDGVERSETAADAAESAQEAAEGYAEAAGNSAITATNAATSAAASAGNAAASATSAGTSATDANASRQAADVSATNAGISERNAAASASAAAGSATSAAASAGQASASATAASGSASTASTKASEAAQSATAAAGSAASASEAAGTASTAATAAENSATAAAGSATAAAGSATSAGQSATAAAGSASDAAEIKDYLDENYGEISEDVNSLKRALNAIGTVQEPTVFDGTDLIYNGFWGVDENGVATITSNSAFYHSAELIPCSPGDILHLVNWGQGIDNPSQIAFSLFNDQQKALNGGSSWNIRFTDCTLTQQGSDYVWSYAIPADGAYIGLCVYPSARFPLSVSVAKLNDYEILSLSENMRSLVADIQDDTLDKKLSAIGTFEEPIVFDMSLFSNGGYWGLTDGQAAIQSNGSYYYYPTLVACQENKKLVLKNWGLTDNVGNLAYSLYNDDGEPYRASEWRINFRDGERTVDSDGNVYDTFIIPTGGRLLGLSIYPTTEHPLLTASATLNEYAITSMSESLKALIDAEVGETDQDLTASIYQKGASPKTFTKNIGIITAGQSNADGRVPISELPSNIILPMTGCNICESESGNFSTFNPTVNWAFDAIVYNQLTQVDDETIYVMKWASGGTAIDPQGSGGSGTYWTVFYEKLSGLDKSLLWKLESIIRACIASQGENFEPRAVLWHQGEADNTTVAAANYYTNLKLLMAYIRGIVGNERLPWVIGTISQNSGAYNATVDNAIRRIAEEDPYVWLVDLKNAQLRDTYHFNAAWAEYFGKKAYDCLVDAGVANGTKFNPTEPT